mgnify:CR=1 FL=1
MSDFYKKNLKFIHENNPFSHKVIIESGELKGREVSGYFHTNHRDRTIDGVPLATDGPIFSCVFDDIKELKSTDSLRLVDEKRIWDISKIMNDKNGRAIIELSERLESDKW